MKYTLLIITLICLNLQAQVSQQWVQRYNGAANGSDQAVSIAFFGSGNLYVTGTVTGLTTGVDIVTIKYDPITGDTLWVSSYAGLSSDQVNAITCDGNAVYLTGRSLNINMNILTLKLDAATGGILWTRTFNGPGNGGDIGLAVEVDPAGNVYVTGAGIVAGEQKMITLKYDAAGNLLAGWPLIYTGSLSTVNDEARAIKVDASGNVYVTGRANISGLADYLTLKINSGGVVQWAKRHNGPHNSEDYCVALVLDNTGSNVFAGGTSFRGGVQNYFIIKYNTATGDSVRSASYDGPIFNIDILSAMTIDNANNVYVTGYSYININAFDYVTLKYNSSLVQQWASRYNGPGNGNDVANYIAVDNYGNVYVTGRSLGSGTGEDYAAVMYNSSGTEKWVARYNGPAGGTDASTSIAVDASGNVYVTGRSAGSGTGTFDYATLKYRQIPIAPSGLEAVADFSSTIALSWSDNSNNEDGFKIERSLNGGINWSLHATLPSDAESYLDTGLTLYSVYHYRLFAFNMFGNSEYSNIAFDTAMSSDPLEYISLLISMVNTLKSEGYLNQGQANSLIVKLNAAIQKIQQGKYNTASNQIGAFINHVNAFINGGVLSPQQGEPLINIAEDVIELLEQMDAMPERKSVSPGLPKEFALHNNFPNPFNPVTSISFDIPEQINVKISVYDVLGKEIKVLLDSRMEPGVHKVTFDASNYPSGIYFYRIETGKFNLTKKMMLVK
jgi:Secretion system C-terminal sorting domain/Beta-propeller repeat